MKNVEELQKEIALLNIEVTEYIVIVKEDNYDNTGDPNYYKVGGYDTLEEAYNDFISEKEKIATLESYSEFKTVEFAVREEDGGIQEVVVETHVVSYTQEDYGKYLLSYRPTNNGIEGIEIKVIDESTPYCVADDKKYSVKFEVLESKEDVVLRIYSLCLYISIEDAEEQFDLSLR